MYYRVNWNPVARIIVMESGADAAPAVINGYMDLGSFRHSPPTSENDTLPGQVYTDSHVLYQHAQEALYHIGQLDMQTVKIFLDIPRTISIGTGTVAMVVGQVTSALPVTTVPANASKEVKFSTSNAAVATVDGKGIVKAISAGDAVITVKSSADESVTATRNVTVTAS